MEVSEERSMKRKIFRIIIVFLTLFVGAVSPVRAQEKTAEEAGRLAGFSSLIVDSRVTKLKAYLEKHDSPMAANAHVFVREADKNGLDWKLVAAIAGTESTFGKHIPSDSFNAWGWGIPTGAQSGIRFHNWEEGIATVSEGLATRYFGRGAKTIYDVGWIYAANGNSWGNHVSFFMNQIDSFIPASAQYLPVSI